MQPHRRIYPVPDDGNLNDHPHGVKQWAIDAEIAKRLWTVSLDLIEQSETGAAPTN